MSPCFQGDPGPGYFAKGTAPYQSEAECNADCSQLGACCDGESCTQKSYCDCRKIPGSYFLGAGTACDSNPCPCTPLNTVCGDAWTNTTWKVDIAGVVVSCIDHLEYKATLLTSDQVNQSGICMIPNAGFAGSWQNFGCPAHNFPDYAQTLTLHACVRPDGSARYDLGLVSVTSDDKSGDAVFMAFNYTKTLSPPQATCPSEIVFTSSDVASNTFGTTNMLANLSNATFTVTRDSCSLSAATNNFCAWWCDNLGSRSQSLQEIDVRLTVRGVTSVYSLKRSLRPDSFDTQARTNVYQFIDAPFMIFLRFLNFCSDGANKYRVTISSHQWIQNVFVVSGGTSAPINVGECCPQGVEIELNGISGLSGVVGTLEVLC